MAQKNGQKVQELREKLVAKGEVISEEIWKYVNSIDHNLSYLLPDDFVNMDKLLEDVDKLLQKDDIAGLKKLLEELASALCQHGQMQGYAIILNSVF